MLGAEGGPLHLPGAGSYLIEAVDARYDGSWYEYHVELVSTRTPTRIRNEQQQEPDEHEPDQQQPEQPDEPDEKG